jgi:hypothetical protein
MKYKAIYILAVGAALISTATFAHAQASDSDLSRALDNPSLTPVLEDASLTPVSETSYVESADFLDADYGCGCGDLACREHLFGDWRGRRSCLAQHGIIADLQFTQFYQGVASGGVNPRDAYGGKLDYQFTFLGEPLGLWKGFTTLLHAETRFGKAVNADAGAFAFPNTSMLYPLPGKNETAITGLLFMQALSERYALAAGKINALDLWQMLYPNSGRGIDGFMNLSLIATPAFFRTTNLSINGAGILAMKGPQIQSGVIVYDTNNSSTTAGLSNLFDQGAVILGYHRFFTEYGGLPEAPVRRLARGPFLPRAARDHRRSAVHAVLPGRRKRRC